MPTEKQIKLKLLDELEKEVNEYLDEPDAIYSLRYALRIIRAKRKEIK